MFRFIINKLFNTEKCILGRWCLERCEKIIDKKIYLSNIDHCGVCN